MGIRNKLLVLNMFVLLSSLMQAVRRDNKQRFSLQEENGELLIRANQGHTLAVRFFLCRLTEIRRPSHLSRLRQLWDEHVTMMKFLLWVPEIPLSDMCLYIFLSLSSEDGVSEADRKWRTCWFNIPLFTVLGFGNMLGLCIWVRYQESYYSTHG